MYRLEKNLVKDFIEILPYSSFGKKGQVDFSTEFYYIRGRTDVIVLGYNQEIIAFEAKLERWRDALHQAYRNTCFAHYSYILVPENVAKLAEKYPIEFSKRSVGICCIIDGEIIIMHKAKPNIPLQKWLYKQAIQEILMGEDDVRPN